MESTVPMITAECEGDFVDLVFAATAGKRQADGRFRLDAIGTHEGQRVGFGVRLGPTWERKKASEGFVVHWGTVCLVSLGESSDRFLETLDSLYEAKSGAKRMIPEVELTAVAIEGNPLHAPDEPVRMKLFFEHDDEVRYGEFYLNIDFSACRVQFHEKDEEYRAAVVMGLSEDAG
jgi:hypothetical protein